MSQAPLTPKSWHVTDDEFRARIAAYNREKPIQNGVRPLRSGPPLIDGLENCGFKVVEKPQASKQSVTSRTEAALESKPASAYSMRAIRWFWPGRFALGKLGLIGGLPDKGKGLISADIIARCTKGENWPCEEGRAPQGNVIWFTAEDDISDTVVPRLAAAGADLDRVHIVGMTKNADGTRMFNLATDLPLLERKLDQVRDVVLVIIDPVS